MNNLTHNLTSQYNSIYVSICGDRCLRCFVRYSFWDIRLTEKVTVVKILVKVDCHLFKSDLNKTRDNYISHWGYKQQKKPLTIRTGLKINADNIGEYGLPFRLPFLILNKTGVMYISKWHQFYLSHLLWTRDARVTSRHLKSSTWQKYATYPCYLYRTSYRFRHRADRRRWVPSLVIPVVTPRTAVRISDVPRTLVRSSEPPTNRTLILRTSHVPARTEISISSPSHFGTNPGDPRDHLSRHLVFDRGARLITASGGCHACGLCWHYTTGRRTPPGGQRPPATSAREHLFSPWRTGRHMAVPGDLSTAMTMSIYNWTWPPLYAADVWRHGRSGVA